MINCKISIDDKVSYQDFTHTCLHMLPQSLDSKDTHNNKNKCSKNIHIHSCVQASYIRLEGIHPKGM